MNETTPWRLKKMSPQFLVTDFTRSIEYYTNKLGFEVEFCFEDFYAGIIKDGYSIHLKSGSPSVEERKKKRKYADLDIVFSVENIEVVYKEFLDKSLEFAQPLCVRSYGSEFYIVDPDGYILAFLEEVP